MRPLSWALYLSTATSLLVSSLNTLYAEPVPPVPTASVLSRVLAIQYSTNFSTGSVAANSTHLGSSFTIDVDHKQYLVTARHVVSGIRSNDMVRLLFSGEWKTVPVISIPVNMNADIAVLAPPYQLTPSLALPASTADMAYGQDAFFLGFPYGLSATQRGFTLPFVKKGIVSLFTYNTNGTLTIYLDGHNNPGFSGGPIVYKPINGNEIWRVMGVVSGYRWEPNKLINVTQTNAYNAYIQENTGIIIGEGITPALEAIKAAPIGATITNE